MRWEIRTLCNYRLPICVNKLVSLFPSFFFSRVFRKVCRGKSEIRGAIDPMGDDTGFQMSDLKVPKAHEQKMEKRERALLSSWGSLPLPTKGRRWKSVPRMFGSG